MARLQIASGCPCLIWGIQLQISINDQFSFIPQPNIFLFSLIYVLQIIIHPFSSASWIAVLVLFLLIWTFLKFTLPPTAVNWKLHSKTQALGWADKFKKGRTLYFSNISSKAEKTNYFRGWCGSNLYVLTFYARYPPPQ